MTMRIQVLVEKNPKRGTAASRFALYRSGMTPYEYAQAVGSAEQAYRDMVWDWEHGWIDIVDDAEAAVRTAFLSALAKRPITYRPRGESGSNDNDARSYSRRRNSRVGRLSSQRDRSTPSASSRAKRG